MSLEVLSVSEAPESEGAERIQQLQDEHAELTRSLLSLTTHFAQVQFRLKQIVAADPDDREKMLMSLEEVASHGCPDVRTREESSNLLQLLSEKDYEERLRDQKATQQHLIQQLQFQLDELERHSMDSQQRANDLQTQFDPELAERQRALIDGLKSKLNINIDIMEAMSVDEVRQSVDSVVHEVTRPARSKEQQIRILASQVEDLERYVAFLKENSGLPVGNHEVVRTEPTRSKPAARTKGKATRNEGVGQLDRKHVPCALVEEDEDEDEEAVDGATEETLLRDRNHQKREYLNDKGQTILRNAAVSSIQWFARFLCGIGLAQRGDELRKEACRALCQKVKQAVDDILTLVASEVNSSPEDDVLAHPAIRTPPIELVKLARLRLGSSLMDVFHYGLIEPLVGTGLVPGWHTLSCTVVPSETVNIPPRNRHHVWQVFEQFYALKKGHEYNSTPARTLSSAFNMPLEGGVAVTPRQRLFDCMMNIQRTHETAYKSPDVKFRSLVCAGMNHGLLAAWCNMVATSDEVTQRNYQPWACIRTSLKSVVKDLERLSSLTFNLSIEPPIGLNTGSSEDLVSSPGE
ncbi:RUN domain-containing protein 1-like [Sycon ciliatum]|uniref:RUN domain-containing protein 1-like n=1 Tax=Sycon ciliatum TaxID=27933 RepID=UPI0031F68EE3